MDNRVFIFSKEIVPFKEVFKNLSNFVPHQIFQAKLKISYIIMQLVCAKVLLTKVWAQLNFWSIKMKKSISWKLIQGCR